MPLNAIMLWTPDTCGNLDNPNDRCIIHLAYDDTVPPASRVYTYVTEAEAQVVHQARINAGTPNTNPSPQPKAHICSAHSGIGAIAALLTTVRDENQRKNITLGLAANVVSAIKLVNYVWSFDAQRVLQVGFVGVAVNTSQKNNIQSACDVQWGPGKVKIS